MPHRTHRKDANHDEIVLALRSRGCKVRSLSSNQGDGMPDLLVLWCGDVFLVEVKTGPAHMLTAAQGRFIKEGWPVRICRTLEDVGRWFPLVDAPAPPSAFGPLRPGGAPELRGFKL